MNFNDPIFVLALLYATVGGVLLSISKIAVNVTLKPVTVCVLGTGNHVIITAFGFLFESAELKVSLGIGLGISFLGILVYTSSKIYNDLTRTNSSENGSEFDPNEKTHPSPNKENADVPDLPEITPWAIEHVDKMSRKKVKKIFITFLLELFVNE